MKKINNFLEKNIEKILIIFLYLQPFLDIITAISIKKFDINLTIGSIVRLLFLVFCFIYLIFINKEHKKKNIFFLIIIGSYFIIYTGINFYYKDLTSTIYEVKNLLNTFYLPVVLIAFIEIFKQYKIEFNLKHLVIIFSIYIFSIIIADITNTSFLSYSHSKLGSIGWFLSANAIGNILSFLLPIVIYYLIYKKNKLFGSLLILSTLYVFATMGTKVPILSLGIILTTNFLYYFIKNVKEKKYKNISLLVSLFLIIIVSTILILPKTSFYKNIKIHMNYYKINSILEIFTDYDNINNLIFSERLTFLKNTNNAYKNASLPAKMFGIGYIENFNTTKESTKTIEIDYFEVFYRHGIVGFIIYFSVFIKFLYIVIKKALAKFNLINIEYLTSIILILLLSLFSGHILVTPAVSIFIAILFCIIIYGFNNDKRKIAK